MWVFSYRLFVGFKVKVKVFTIVYPSSKATQRNVYIEYTQDTLHGAGG